MRRLQISALFVSCVLTILLLLQPAWMVRKFSYLLFFIYACLFSLLLKRPYGEIFLFCVVVLSVLLKIVNKVKIAATQLPVTMLDLKISASDPAGLWNAVKPSPSVIISIVAGMILFIGIIAFFIHRSFKHKHRSPNQMHQTFLFRLALIATFLISFSFFLYGYSTAVQSYTKDMIIWTPTHVADLSRYFGSYGFLVYSYTLEHASTGPYFRPVTSMPPPNKEIQDAARMYVKPLNPSPAKLPNILLVLAESTFDVNDIFNITVPVKNALFEKNEYTQALGSLYVNPVGGGTWMSEFESLVGLDERLFGYYGYYTHSSLSPFVKKSFVRYLKEKGYTSTAYYSVEESFYNARKGYENYGFDHFFGSEQLNLPPSWKTTDVEVAEAAIKESQKQQGEPFFKFITLIQNHAPHDCKQPPGTPLNTEFQAGASFEENCILQEYLRRADSTSQAFQKLLSYMQSVTSRTGRPFVFLIYGDHQPHTFTHTGGYYKYTFDRYRKDRNVHHTFFHLLSSIPGVVTCCPEVSPHLTTIPTMLSAYVAKSYEDLYLGVNLYAYRYCGEDFIGSSSCKVFDQLLAAYQQSGVFVK